MCLLKDAGFNIDGGEYTFTDIYLTNAILCARRGKNDSSRRPDKYFNVLSIIRISKGRVSLYGCIF
jgi:hypothetical protein